MSEKTDYALWRERFGSLTPEDRVLMEQDCGLWLERPLLSVLMPVYNPKPEFLRAALESVLGQAYPAWELCIADDASTDPEIRAILEEYQARDTRVKIVFRERNGHICEASNSALKLCKGVFTVLMDHDDLLTMDALYHVAREITIRPGVNVIYSDMDHLDESKEHYAPYFKSDWDEELLLAQNYFCHLSVFRTSLLKHLGGFRPGFEGVQDHDLVLRCALHSTAEQLVHIPRILYHWRHFPGSGTTSDVQREHCDQARMRIVEEYLHNKGVVATVSQGVWGFTVVHYKLPDPPPSVTCIVPAKNQADKTRNCLEGLLEQTEYPALDVILVDNGSTDEDALALCKQYGAHPRVRVISWHKPFDYSEINNMAARKAKGNFLALVNNDIRILSADWLTIMLGYAVQPRVGAVGAKLLYPDGRIQHAGVVLLDERDIARETFKGRLGDSDEFFALAQIARETIAVTGACLVIDKEKYFEVGGLEEGCLPVAFSDVDLCCKLYNRGYRNIYTPHAVLCHLESSTRGTDDTPTKIASIQAACQYMRKTWRHAFPDPYYNPHLSRQHDCYQLLQADESPYLPKGIFWKPYTSEARR